MKEDLNKNITDQFKESWKYILVVMGIFVILGGYAVLQSKYNNGAKKMQFM